MLGTFYIYGTGQNTLGTNEKNSKIILADGKYGIATEKRFFAIVQKS